MPTESHPLPDEIHIEQLDVFTRIGVPEEERAEPQKLMVSISFWPSEKIGNAADNIERTVNYSAVAGETKKFVRDQSLNLIETLGDRLAMHLLKTFPIRKVTIEVRKFPLPDAEYAVCLALTTLAMGSNRASAKAISSSPIAPRRRQLYSRHRLAAGL